MKKLLIVAWGILGCLPVVQGADEPAGTASFDTTGHYVMTLSARQLEEVESRRRVTLSPDQLKALRARAPSFPKRIGVASAFVDDIAESRFSLWPNQVTGIWYDEARVAIPLNGLDGVGGCREFSKTLCASDAVLIDTRGSYSIGPRKVDFESLVRRLDELALMEPEGTDFEIFVLRPPVLSDRREAVVREAIDNLAGACEERGLGCRIGG